MDLRIVGRLLLVVCLTIAMPARSDVPVHAGLVYARETGAETCPESASIKDAVAVRLGYSPFQEPAQQRVEVVLTHRSSGLVATVRLLDMQGHLLGQREIASSGTDCRELADALSLAVSMALDPVGASRLRPVVQPSADPHPAPESVADGDAPKSLPATPLHLNALLGLVGGVGNAPSVPTLGGVLEVELRLGRGSILLGGRTDIPAGPSVLSGSIHSSLLVGEAAGCFREWVLGGCAVVLAGELVAQASNLYEPSVGTGAYVAAGARVFGELPLTGLFAARLSMELVAPLTRTSLGVGTMTVFTTPPVAGNAALSAVIRFR